MKEQILAIVLDPIFWGVCASGVMSIISFFVVKSGKEKAEFVYAMLIKAFYYAEKAIPDNTENKAFAKTDIALKELNEFLAEGNIKMSDKIKLLAKKMWTIWAAKQKGIV